MDQYDGILLCSKPYGISSHKIISQLRPIIQQKKIGHTGTLDPRATGLLVLCLGRATKIAQFLENFDKSYEAQIKLGQRSTTYDSEGIIDDVTLQPVPDISTGELDELLNDFRGLIRQKVPAYSAVKVNGQRLYKMARRGEEVDAPVKEIEIKKLSVTGLELPDIYLNIDCSRGTYIRTLANDIGEKLGCGAYLAALTRTRVGPYFLKDALNLKTVKHYRDAGVLKKYIVPIESVLPFPWLKVSEEFSSHIITGQSPKLKDISEVGGTFKAEELISLKDHNDNIRAVGRAEVDSGRLENGNEQGIFKYVRVLN